MMGLGRIGATVLAMAIFCVGSAAAQLSDKQQMGENAMDLALDPNSFIGKTTTIFCPVANVEMGTIYCFVPNRSGYAVDITSVETDTLKDKKSLKNLINTCANGMVGDQGEKCAYEITVKVKDDPGYKPTVHAISLKPGFPE